MANLFRSFFLALIFVTTCLENGMAKVKVCEKYKNFYDPFSKHCWTNDFDSSNLIEVTNSWGFSSEKFNVKTEDGYIITVFRVYKGTIRQNTPIVLGHGSIVNAFSWVFAGNNSLAYVLGNLGYDVWIPSWRGTAYSLGHVSLSYKSDKYWKFGYHQIGIYDLKSTLDLVQSKTNEKALYLPYSMGSSIGFAYCSLKVSHCKDHLRGTIAMAPLTSFIDAKGVFPILWIPPIWTVVRKFTYLIFNGQFLKSNIFTKILLRLLSLTPVGNYLAIFGLDFLYGFNIFTIDSTYFPVVLNTFNDRTGINIYTQFQQNHNRRNFTQFDYGKTKNLKIYNQEKAPTYPLKKIPIPVTVFYGGHDFLATPKATAESYIRLPLKCGYYSVSNKKYNHADWILAKDLQTVVYEPLIKNMQTMLEGKCSG